MHHIYLCECILRILSHELILVIHGYDQRMLQVSLHYQDCRNKGFMFTIKEVWDQVCSPENQFLASAVANDRSLPL